MRMKSFAYSVRAILMLYSMLLLVSASPFATVSPYRNLTVETRTLGGSNSSVDQVVLSKRQEDRGLEAVPESCSTFYDCRNKYSHHLHVDTINDLPEEPKPAAPPVGEVAPANPPGNLQCKPFPKGRYRHAHKKYVKAVTMDFCNDYCAPENADPVILPIRKMFSARRYGYSTVIEDWSAGYLRHEKVKRKDDVYDLRVDLQEGCTQNGTVNLRMPLEGHFCKDILFDAWHNCDNKGRGGSLQAGCVRYSISPRF